LLLLLLPALALTQLACDGSPSRSDGPRDVGRERQFQFPEAGLVPEGGADLVTPGSDRCLGAAPLPLVDGKAAVQGTTEGASNEYAGGVRCGEASGLVGPQRYYRVALVAGTTYRVELTPSFAAALYLGSACGQATLDTDCGSGGATGGLARVAAGASGALFFTPGVAGEYVLAVDSAAPAEKGTFALTVEGFAAPANAVCTGAQPLALAGGSATLQASTLGAKNEWDTQLHCGLAPALSGPQVYYTVSLTEGLWYRLSLSPSFTASLYLASNAAGCKPANLEADCSGLTGTVLGAVPAGGRASTAFSPPKSGTYLLAVDSNDPDAAGSFTLEVEVFSPPAGMTCSAATPLALPSGEASTTGDTGAYLNDRGAQVRCGALPPLVAPQAYYQLELKQVPYELLLQPGFPAVLAIGGSCQTLPIDCGSGGLSGASLSVPAGKSGGLLFTPPVAGSFVIAVDGTAQGGPFSLTIREHTPPTNGACSSPQALSLVSGTGLASGDTGPLKNDLAGISCGSALGPWSGPQAYHRVQLQGGASYQVTVQPEAGFDPALYAFPAATACEASAVNAACAGHASDVIGVGQPESLTLAPAQDGDWILVVDSWSPSEVGSYSLAITKN